MSGLGNGDLREAVWERQVWRGAEGMGEGGTWGGGGQGGNGGGGGQGGNGEGGDQRLRFEDVEMLCKRLNINPSKDDLLRRFQVSFFSISISFSFSVSFLLSSIRLSFGRACMRVQGPKCGTSASTLRAVHRCLLVVCMLMSMH